MFPPVRVIAQQSFPKLGYTHIVISTGWAVKDVALKYTTLHMSSDKIDWTTLNPNYTTFLWNNDMIDIGASGTNDIPKLTWTCQEKGGYVVLAEGNIMQVGSTVRFPRIGIYCNGNRVSYSAVSLLNSNQQLSWSCIWYGSLSQGVVIKVAASDGYDCRLFEGQHLIIFRIN